MATAFMGFIATALAVLSATSNGKQTTVPLDLVKQWPVATVSINGAPLRFIVDTGAGGSVIDQRVAERMRLRAAGDAEVGAATSTSQTKLVLADKVAIGNIQRQAMTMVVADMSQFEGGYAGIIGNDFFREHALVMDIPGKKLTLSDEDRPPLPGGGDCLPNVLPSRPEHLAGFAVVSAELPAATGSRRVKVTAIVDSGAKRSILNFAGARALGLATEDPRLKAAVGGKGLNGKAAPVSHSYKLSGLSLGPWEAAPAEIRVSDFAVFKAVGLQDVPAIILGSDILAQRAFGISKGAGLFCIARA